MPNIKTNFEYHVPATLDEALALMDQYGAEARVVAGGTDLIPKIKAGIRPFTHLVSLKAIDGLNDAVYEPGVGITIGACVPLRVNEANPDIVEHYPALFQGMHSMANTQVRNRGTITGNICNAIPSADTAPALIVYGAEVKARTVSGERIIPIDEFFTGVGRTCLEPNEIVTEIFIPEPPAGAFSIYYKYAVRKALDLAMIGVAVCVATDDNNVVTSAKIALGAVAIVPKRAPEAEAIILGKELTEDVIEQAAQAAAQLDCKPISDIRATEEYRRRMVYVHVRDALRKVVNA